MSKTLEDYPTSLKSMVLGQEIMFLALTEGVDVAIKNRDERIQANREVHGYDGFMVLVTVPRIAFYGLQKRVLKGLVQ